MRGLRADEANHIALLGLDHHPLGQHDMTPPSSKEAEFDETFIGDQLDNKSNFVHMSCEHNPWFFCFTILPTDNTTQPVLLNRRNLLKIFTDNLSNRLLIT